MSHFHERHEKDCLNCGATVTGRYCSACGQENVEPKETVGHLAMHFFEDLTHFDGKFFTTLHLLLFKPGFLSEEYVKGKRAGYLHPVRMYFFISFLFFLLLFSGWGHDEKGADSHKNIPGLKITKKSDSTAETKDISAQEFADSIQQAIYNTQTKRDSIRHSSVSITSSGGHGPLVAQDTSITAYETRQASLPKDKKDGWLGRYFNKRMVAAREYSHKHPDEFYSRMKEKFPHALSQLLFTSLPFYGLLLYLLYVRRRKKYYYVSHVIFTIHFYCATFIIWIAYLMFNYIDLGWVSTIIQALLFLWIFVYSYLAMLRFYQQGAFKTFLKFLLLNLGFFILMIFLGVIFSINYILSIAS